MPAEVAVEVPGDRTSPAVLDEAERQKLLVDAAAEAAGARVNASAQAHRSNLATTVASQETAAGDALRTLSTTVKAQAAAHATTMRTASAAERTAIGAKASTASATFERWERGTQGVVNLALLVAGGVKKLFAERGPVVEPMPTAGGGVHLTGEGAPFIFAVDSAGNVFQGKIGPGTITVNPDLTVTIDYSTLRPLTASPAPPVPVPAPASTGSPPTGVAPRVPPPPHDTRDREPVP